MTGFSNGTNTRAGRGWLIGLCALSFVLVLKALGPVVLRVLHPYDFVTWPDDYVLNELLKAHLGAPLYGSYADANSYIYAPGGVWLHRALLAPFGLDLSLVANRVLSQLWFALAVALGVRLVGSISVGRFQGRREHVVSIVGAASALLLAGYSNSIVDSLHPAALELFGLMMAATVAARWPRLSLRSRLIAALLLPAFSLLAKQTGVAIAPVLAAAALLTPGPQRERLLCAALCLCSPVLTFIGLLVVTDGAFLQWGLLLPLRQPMMPHHLVYVLSCVSTITPLLVLIGVGVSRGVREHGDTPHAAWLRVAGFPLAYLILTTPAFLKVGGGAFDYGALAFLCCVLALAQVRNVLSGADQTLSIALVGLLAAFQLLLFIPYRRAPTPGDRVFGEQLCAHIKEAVRCGEKVLLDMGTSCLVEAGVKEVPRDRLSNLMELTWAGLIERTGTAKRIEDQDYDLIAVHVFIPPWPWPAAAVTAIGKHYASYKTLLPGTMPLPGEFDLNDRARFDGWQGLDFGMTLFERKADAGRHRIALDGPAPCRPRGSAPPPARP